MYQIYQQPMNKLKTKNVDMALQALRVSTKKNIFLFLNQKYVLGTQKNCLSETVLSISQNIC